MGLKVFSHTQAQIFIFMMFGTIITSIHVLAAKVLPIEKHQLDLVAFVEGDEEDEQQEDRSQPPCQLHRVHELC